MTQCFALRGKNGPAYVRNATTGFIPVGLEVEVERCLTAPPPLQGWATHMDGSLRNNGMEFVFTTPVRTEAGLTARVKRLVRTCVEQGYVTNERTGIHVHVNVDDFHVDKVIDVLLAYTLVEPALFLCAGRAREENPYCSPWYENPQQLVTFCNAAANVRRGLTRNAYTMIRKSAVKYAALNIAPITTQGSIEFRHFPTVFDADTILAWTGVVQKIVDYGLNNDLRTLLSLHDPDDITPAVLAHAGLGEYANWHSDIEPAVVIATALPSFMTTVPPDGWRRMETTQVKQKRRARETGREFVNMFTVAGRTTNVRYEDAELIREALGDENEEDL